MHYSEWDWRIVCIFQLLVPIFICILVPTIPGTPRWFIQHGNQVEKARASLWKVNRIEKARDSLRKVRDTEQEVENEILMIREALEYEKEAISSGYSALWKDKSVRKRLLLAFILNAGQQITGQGTLNSYSSTIYKKVFLNSSQIALINALNATFGILFTLNAAWTADRFGRKFLFIVGAVGMGICMLIVAAVGSETPTTASGGKSTSVGIAVRHLKPCWFDLFANQRNKLTFLFFFFAFFYKPSWGACTWIWTSEVFSMNVRGQAIGMASQTQNVANSIFQQFFPTFLANCGFYTFYFFAGIDILLAAFVWFLYVSISFLVALDTSSLLSLVSLRRRASCSKRWILSSVDPTMSRKEATFLP